MGVPRVKTARYDLVHVDWDDPVTPNGGGWVTLKGAHRQEIARIRSVGWLLIDEPDRVGIGSCYQTNASSDVGSVTIIPRGCIRELVVLKRRSK
jgi:hypothetical protein